MDGSAGRSAPATRRQHPGVGTKLYAVPLADGHVVSDDRDRLDMDVVHRALAGAYWAVGRGRDLTDRSFANCLVLGVYDPMGRTVGFGRVLTDYALRAHIADVMVLPWVRGRGLGRALIEFAFSHPDLITVMTWTLATADAQGLYARYGFRAVAGDPNWMVLHRAEAGGSPA